MNQARVYVIDDDSTVLQILEAVLTRAEFDVRACDCPWTFFEEYEPEPVGCLVLDLWLPGMSGLQLVGKVREMGGRHPFIIISGDADIEIATKAMRLGAFDFFEKPFDEGALVSAVQLAIQCDEDNQEQQRIKQTLQQEVAALTQREKKVLELYASGTKSEQVAESLDISVKTVYTHRCHILQKMHVSSMSELIAALDRSRVNVEIG